MLNFRWRRELLTRGRVVYSLWAWGSRHDEFRICAYELPPSFPVSDVCRLVKRDVAIINELVAMHFSISKNKR